MRLQFSISLILLMMACGSEDREVHSTPYKYPDVSEDKRGEIQNDYLEKHIFHDLKNLNSGFDADGIRYFSESDFKIVLERVEKHKIEIYGIEPWLDGRFYDVATYEMFESTADDPTWYWKAFNDFAAENDSMQYSATYHVPDYMLFGE